MRKWSYLKDRKNNFSFFISMLEQLLKNHCYTVNSGSSARTFALMMVSCHNNHFARVCVVEFLLHILKSCLVLNPVYDYDLLF